MSPHHTVILPPARMVASDFLNFSGSTTSTSSSATTYSSGPSSRRRKEEEWLRQDERLRKEEAMRRHSHLIPYSVPEQVKRQVLLTPVRVPCSSQYMDNICLKGIQRIPDNNQDVADPRLANLIGITFGTPIRRVVNDVPALHVWSKEKPPQEDRAPRIDAYRLDYTPPSGIIVDRIDSVREFTPPTPSSA